MTSATGPHGDVPAGLLRHGRLEVVGRLVDASNATLLATVHGDGATLACVYKPVAGERPLWDFPAGSLARREVASYALSELAGWGAVPLTVLRDGPLGPGSVQLWVGPVPPDAALPGAGSADAPTPGAGVVDVLPVAEVPEGWLPVLSALTPDGRPVVLAHADDPALRRLALLDAVANNADRKGGHVVRDDAGSLLGVDHGLTFHPEPKLRTVLWGWAGRRIDAEWCGDLERLGAALARQAGENGRGRERLSDLLAPEELAATAERLLGLLQEGRYPRPPAGARAIPWPAF